MGRVGRPDGVVGTFLRSARKVLRSIDASCVGKRLGPERDGGRHDRIDAPWLLDGPINGASFRTYVETALLPTLRPGDIVVMDNLGSHKGIRDSVQVLCVFTREFLFGCK